MTTEIATLPESGTLADIQKLIIEHRQRLIPVVRREDIVGVITRTDLLSLLVNDPAHLSTDLLARRRAPFGGTDAQPQQQSWPRSCPAP